MLRIPLRPPAFPNLISPPPLYPCRPSCRTRHSDTLSPHSRANRNDARSFTDSPLRRNNQFTAQPSEKKRRPARIPLRKPQLSDITPNSRRTTMPTAATAAPTQSGNCDRVSFRGVSPNGPTLPVPAGNCSPPLRNTPVNPAPHSAIGREIIHKLTPV